MISRKLESLINKEKKGKKVDVLIILLNCTIKIYAKQSFITRMENKIILDWRSLVRSYSVTIECF